MWEFFFCAYRFFDECHRSYQTTFTNNWSYLINECWVLGGCIHWNEKHPLPSSNFSTSIGWWDYEMITYFVIFRKFHYDNTNHTHKQWKLDWHLVNTKRNFGTYYSHSMWTTETHGLLDMAFCETLVFLFLCRPFCIWFTSIKVLWCVLNFGEKTTKIIRISKMFTMNDKC